MPRKNQSQQARAGFTIIEVVLVLAIAGLIFLMVFVALPALQRSQRDTARRNDMSRVDTSLVQYQTNNSSSTNNLPGQSTWRAYGAGDFPTGNSCNTACQFIRDYMNSGASGEKDKNTFQDPDGSYYSLVITNNWANNDQLEWDSIASGGFTSTLQQGTAKSGATGYTINNGSFSDHVVYIIPGSKCDGEYIVKTQEQRHFSVLYRLEGAGVYCIDDQ